MNKLVEYYENGTVKKEYFLNEDCQLEGSYKEYHDNGNVLVDCIYKDGKVEGEAHIYKENGDLFLKYYYQDGSIKSMVKIFKN